MGEVLDLGNLWEQVNADDVNIAGSVFKLLLDWNAVTKDRLRVCARLP